MYMHKYCIYIFIAWWEEAHVGSASQVACSFQVLGATLVRTCIDNLHVYCIYTCTWYMHTFCIYALYIYIVWWEEAHVGSAGQVACGVS